MSKMDNYWQGKRREIEERLYPRALRLFPNNTSPSRNCAVAPLNPQQQANVNTELDIMQKNWIPKDVDGKDIVVGVRIVVAVGHYDNLKLGTISDIDINKGIQVDAKGKKQRHEFPHTMAIIQ